MNKQSKGIIQSVLFVIAELLWVFVPQFKQRMLSRFFGMIHGYYEKFSPFTLLGEGKYNSEFYIIVFFALLALAASGLILQIKGNRNTFSKIASFAPFISCVLTDILVLTGVINLIADGSLSIISWGYLTGAITFVLCLVGYILTNKEEN